MNTKLSRRAIARYVVAALEAGRPQADVLREAAAYLRESRRLRETDLVVRAIEDEMAERGTVIARVTTARPIADDVKAAIVQLVGARDVQLVETIDPSVVGGVRVETPGHVFDATMKRKLLALRQAKM